MIKIFKLKQDNTKIKLLYSNNVFHPTETTNFLLNSVLQKINKNKNKNKKIEILDLGCGNGIIGIFLLKKFKKIKKVTFSDLSINAVKLTQKNLKLNKIKPHKYETVLSDKFENLSNKKFDIIINDVSGISSEIVKITDWFKNVPSDTGTDGTKLTKSILSNFPKYLSKKGLFFFPIISLSNEKIIFEFMKKLKIKFNIISINSWPVPKVLYKHLDRLKYLRKNKKINFDIKHSFVVANTKILLLKT